MAGTQGVRFVFGRRTTPRELFLQEGDYVQVEALPPGSLPLPLGAVYRVSKNRGWSVYLEPLKGATEGFELHKTELNILFKRWRIPEIKLSDYE